MEVHPIVMTKTILILAANPADTSRLRLDEEVREIENGLRLASRRDDFVLRQIWAPRPADVRRAVLDTRPSIVHFCGHGSGNDGLAFEDQAGASKLVSADALSGFFALFSDTVECVVLNACYSAVQAAAIAKHVADVIGMPRAIGDTTAIEFAVAFYDALGAGRSVAFAHRVACNAIEWTGLDDGLTPVLHRRPAAGSSAPPDETLRFPFDLTPRMPCLLLLDVSASMAGEKISRLSSGLRGFVDDLRADEHVKARVELAVVTFGDSVVVLRDFASVRDFDIPRLAAGGPTPMGEAIILALDLLDHRIIHYQDHGMAHYRPLVLLVTDGSPTDSWDDAVNRLHTESAKRRIRFVAVGADDADMELLGRISPPGTAPVALRDLRFSQMFMWLSSSMQTLHDDETQLPLPPADWAVI
jgi:uncharacterized protein YegL